MELKFLCDQMLADLGRWLRAAGYDTRVITNSIPDSDIFELGRKENRCLLTRDQHFLGKENVLFLKGNSLKEHIEQLKKELHLNWLYRPFSRCLVCNSELIDTDQETVSAQVPPNMVAKHFWYCSHCKKVYWEGSHTDRMRKQLEEWNS